MAFVIGPVSVKAFDPGGFDQTVTVFRFVVVK
jgi:hypothetical protein